MIRSMAPIPANSVVRTCRYSHGPLQMVDGWFSLTGANPRELGPGETVPPGEPPFNQDPWRIFVLRVWRCPVCGYAELADEEP
jgi:hypothetical protein